MFLPLALNKAIFFLLLFFLALVAISVQVQAEDYTSTDFILRDPVITAGGSRSVSTSFELIGGLSQLVSGEQTSASFIGRSGWLYFAVVTAPVVTATAGDGQVSFTWTASVSSLGASVASYAIGQSTTSGGPYTFTDVGAVLSATRSGLSNSTTYYFVVQARDSSGRNLAQSSQVSALPTPAPTATPAPVSGGGGGGGGGIITPPVSVNQVIFRGLAYPQSDVTVLKDAQVAGTTKAGADAKFEIALSGISAGTYTFGVYAEDALGNRSLTHNFTISIAVGATTIISGIFLPPSISIDKTEVKRGDLLTIMGYSAPQAEIAVIINSEGEILKKTSSLIDGTWAYKFDTLEIEYGDHNTKARSTKDNDISTFSKALAFKVGDRSIFATPTQRCGGKADLNSDCKVNLVDFSIAAYWYKRALNVSFRVIEKDKLNNDGKVDLIDFSIMAYYWTG